MTTKPSSGQKQIAKPCKEKRVDYWLDADLVPEIMVVAASYKLSMNETVVKCLLRGARIEAGLVDRPRGLMIPVGDSKDLEI